MNEYSIHKWADLTGVDRHAVAKRLAKIGAKPVGKGVGKGKAHAADLYSVRDLFVASSGDAEIEAERLRKTTEEADKLAIANARSRGELVDISKVIRLGQNVLIAVRNRILNMPLTDDEKDGCLRELLALKDMDWTRDA